MITYPPWKYLGFFRQNEESVEYQTEINLLNMLMSLILWLNENKTNGLWSLSVCSSHRSIPYHRQIWRCSLFVWASTQCPETSFFTLGASNTFHIQKILCISMEHKITEDLWTAVFFNHQVNREVHFIKATIGSGREFCCLVKFLNLQTDTW